MEKEFVVKLVYRSGNKVSIPIRAVSFERALCFAHKAVDHVWQNVVSVSIEDVSL